jgi:outer membrane protein
MFKASLKTMLLGSMLLLAVQTAGAEPGADVDSVGSGRSSGLKIGVVDVMSLIDRSAQMDSARKKIEREFKPRETKLLAEKEEITKMEERLTKEADVLSEDKQKELSKEIMRRVREFKTQEDGLRQDFNQSRNEEMSKLQKSISEAIKSLAQEERFDLILHEGVVYANDAINVTAKVASRLEGGIVSSKGSKKNN